jgi:muramoyltetrapeptide carboxypeptidase
MTQLRPKPSVQTLSMQKVNALKPGGTIGIVAPASSVKEESLLNGSAELQRLGFHVCYSESVLARHYYFAGLHEERAAEVTQMFEDPRIDAIFCARGGYGCHHLLTRLNPGRINANPKIFIGYSDITVLLQFLENACQMTCFHGPMVARELALGESFYVKESLLECLTRVSPGQRITSSGLETIQPGIARGRLTGGCLSLLTATLGTAFEIQTAGKILFLEDVNAAPYQVDRMLMHLKLAGKLEKVQGIVFGEMLNCVLSSEQEYGLQEIIFDVLKDFRFPVLYGLPSGHTSTAALTLPFGVPVVLNASEQYLELEEAAVQ